MICVDASFVVRLVLDGADGPAATLWNRWLSEREEFAAPSLLGYEVTNALHRYRAAGHIDSNQCVAALDAALGLGVVLYEGADVHRRALALAARLQRPATYDTHYLAVAEKLGAPFWTADLRLYNAVRERLKWVHTLA